MSDEVILKTSFMGFDKKEVMDYIESLQKENRELKKRIAQLEGRPVSQEPETAPEPDADSDEPLPKIQNVNLQNPLEEDSADQPEQDTNTETADEEEEFEPDVAAAMSRADEAIAQADESIVLNDDKYSDAVTAIYNAVMEAVSHSDEIQVELENGKKEEPEPEESEEKAQESDPQPKTEKHRNPVKVKVKIKPKKEE